MFWWLFQHLQPHLHVLRVFHYLTFRSIVSAITGFLIAYGLTPRFIAWLKQKQIKQAIRNDGPASHLQKSGTPTMGGVLILIALTLSVLLWGDLANYYLVLVLLTTLAFGVIGAVDDYRKVIKQNSKGLSALSKYLWQSGVALVAVASLYVSAKTQVDTQLVIPFVKHAVLSLGGFYIIFTYFVVVGTSNAVNLTDGLDGLALMPTVLISIALAIFAYVSGNYFFSHYLSMPFIPGVGELVIFCSALVGSGLGFLWYNSYPAEIFMGDVGSLSLGAALGLLSVIVRQELILLVMGGVFVAETVSVILQVGSFKLRGRRIFKMAPLHHHFELKGCGEPKVIVRFWIVTVILVLIGLSTLKLR